MPKNSVPSGLPMAQARGLDTQDADIRALVITDDVGVIGGAILQLNGSPNIVSADDVCTGDNIGVFAGFIFTHDDSGALTGFILALADHVL